MNRYSNMVYNYCGRSGLKLPAISLGLWHNFGTVDVFSNMQEMARTAFDLGITHFDLANNYGPTPGSAEENFGKILRSTLHGHRDELIISTKAGYGMWPGPYGDGGSRKYLLASLDQSLKRMALEPGGEEKHVRAQNRQGQPQQAEQNLCNHRSNLISSSRGPPAPGRGRGR